MAAKAFKTKLVWDEDTNKKQALIPEGAQALPNKYGTAPGVYFKPHKTDFYFMPGVPSEMKYIFNTHVFPAMLEKSDKKIYFAKAFLKTFGSSESDLDNALKDLFHERTHIDHARIGFRFSFPEIYLKVSAWDADETKAQALCDDVVARIKERVGHYIYAENQDDTLESVVIKKLDAAHKTIAFAESCTGGLIASRITSVSGASKIFKGSIVSYANDVKQHVLHVDESILKKHGAVSKACAIAMVEGVHKITNADYCAAVTGIAGPTGGADEKPVGTVHVATLCDGVLHHKEYHFNYPREMFRTIVSSVVLRRFLLQ
ncbi:nicotinamide-nucleotide amidohydrolase family protein [bacterium]|nr:nicotinamide-nucleotide amidohydrolase family protein [bacterium]